jgi:simple sugar transport system permease protein
VILVPLYVAAIVGALLDGKTANMTNVFAGTLEYAVPVSLGAFAGILSERSGMLNIAIEGKFLLSACAAAISASIVTTITGSGLAGIFAGVLTAMLAGVGVGFLLAWLGIRHKVDQIIAGVVVNIGAIGITNFVFLRILGKNTWLNTPPTIDRIKVPLLSEIPVVGPLLFSGTPYLYFTIATMLFLTYMLFRTRWGLRLRASGEKPSAAGTVGIDVIKIRYRSMLLAGALAGIAGSYLSLASAGSFQMGMSAGKGFIALAAVIFGAWNPIGAFGAALVFGFSDAIQSLLSILGVDVPPQLLNSVPYLVTIIVVAGVVGRVRGPAAAGQPYDQG